MKKLFFALMAVAAIAIVGCENQDPILVDESVADLVAPNNIIPPTDTDGANQNRWGLVPERIPLTVTSTENDEE